MCNNAIITYRKIVNFLNGNREKNSDESIIQIKSAEALQ